MERKVDKLVADAMVVARETAMKITQQDTPGTSRMLDYYVNIYHMGVFQHSIRYEGFSGTAMQEEITELRVRFPLAQGYSLEW